MVLPVLMITATASSVSSANRIAVAVSEVRQSLASDSIASKPGSRRVISPGRVSKGNPGSAALSAVIGDDGVIGGADQLIDERWRRLAASQMLLYCGDQHLGKKELSAPQLTRAVATEDQAGKSAHSSLDLSILRGNPVAELLWPARLTEIVSVVEQHQTRLVEMLTPHADVRNTAPSPSPASNAAVTPS